MTPSASGRVQGRCARPPGGRLNRLAWAGVHRPGRGLQCGLYRHPGPVNYRSSDSGVSRTVVRRLMPMSKLKL